MGTDDLGKNIVFPIYNSNGTTFHDLKLYKSSVDSVVMSLGDKITGDVYYIDNTLVVNMSEYIMFDGVKYTLVNPPVVVREGIVSDNSELKGMTKYSFTFYHPMYMLGNFPFTDVAVNNSELKFKSQDSTFSWIGNLVDFVAKLNKNLEGTEWVVEVGDTVSQDDRTKLSQVLTFDKQKISDALKTGYEEWDIPYIIDQIATTDARYAHGKRFLVRFGLPSQEILASTNPDVPYVFRFGQGVGLKNNSRNPRNNKIITRIAGYGSETNVPWGYPQIVWTGDQTWDYTIDNDSTNPLSYPIYDGIVNGQRVRLIKHPFTRNHVMPSVYAETVNLKVNPNATGYNPNTEIKDYYDADDGTYENPIKLSEPSYEIHEFSDIKPELGESTLTGVYPYDEYMNNSVTLQDINTILKTFYSESKIKQEKTNISTIQSIIATAVSQSGSGDVDGYVYSWSIESNAYYAFLTYTSSSLNFKYTVQRSQAPQAEWNDDIDDEGNYVQGYFKVKLPVLSFDIYACAAATEEMTINMRSGACIGCNFKVQVDWEDYKRNMYDADGNFAPNGSQRDLSKYPNSSQVQVTLIVQKDTETFGVLMPNAYQKPAVNDKYVILGISLPYTYVTDAEDRLDDAMEQYMHENNVYYYDYPLKFDEYFLASNIHILQQIKTNTIVRFEYGGSVHALYVKQLTVRYGESPLPKYEITLTDDVEIVLNQIGQVADEVSKIRMMLGAGTDLDLALLDSRYLSKIDDDTANGFVKFLKGIQVSERFTTGLLGEGGVFRTDEDGTTYLEVDKMYVRMKAYFDTVEVRRYMHSNGNRVASLAGAKVSRVEYIDSNGDVTNDASDAVKFRCYFRVGEDSNTATNDFVVGDLVYCHVTNASVAQGIEQHHYWRAVVGRNTEGTLTTSGEAYVDLSASDCQTGSDIPLAQDDIIQLGNKTDTTRQGAIVEFVGGEDAPSYQIYQGINTYSFVGKNVIGMGYSSQTARAYMNVYGDMYVGDPQGSTFLQYNQQTRTLNIKAAINASSTVGGVSLQAIFDGFQDQLDGVIDSWFYSGVPTLSNAPANTWTTNTEKDMHLGDLYYDEDTGFAYRFMKDGTTGTYYWNHITDDAVAKALADAAHAQDTADHKRRVFTSTPYPPYDVGDLWVNATYPANTTPKTYENDVLRCSTAKGESDSFNISDWTRASKYTDDSKFNGYINQILNGTGATGDSATVANAIKNIKNALNEGTVIDGGLVLTSLIAMRASNVVWSGISGQYNSSSLGGGIAYWAGGAMKDYDTLTDAQKNNGWSTERWAKIVHRFDGSGYIANHNIRWDADGVINVSNVNQLSALSIMVNNQLVATQPWVSQNFLTIAFFDRLFRAYHGSTLVNANDTTTVIDNIKSMFGFWTEFYLSALGTGGASSVSISLGQLSDVNIASATNGQVLTYDSTSGKWIPTTVSGGGGTDMNTVWTNLAAATNEQINATHISTALNGYATQLWVSNQGYVSSSTLDGYLPLTGGTLTGSLVSQGDISSYGGIDALSIILEDVDLTRKIYIGHTGISGYNEWAIKIGSTSYTSGDFGIDWYGNFVGGGFWKNGSNNNYVLLGGGGHSQLKTINGNSVFGTGDITISVTGNYLPLTGGELSGALYVTDKLQINSTSEPQLNFHIPNVDWGNLRLKSDGVFYFYDGFGANTLADVVAGKITTDVAYSTSFQASGSCDFNNDVSIGTNASNNVLTLKAWLNSTGAANFSGNVSAAGFLKSGSNNNYVLLGGGGHSQLKTVNGNSIFGSGDIYISGGSGWATYYTETDGYYNPNSMYNIGMSKSRNVSGGPCSYGVTFTMPYRKASGNSIPDYGCQIFLPNGDDSSYPDALFYRTSMSSYWRAWQRVQGASMSDIRLKNIVGTTSINLSDIANAPIVTFTWKENYGDKFMHVGSIAQYWQRYLPLALTMEYNGFYSMDYGVIALTSTIMVARKVVNHDEKIRLLETRVEALEKENNELRKLIA